jgi:transcriptional regulator with XRE-family HTH domain
MNREKVLDKVAQILSIGELIQCYRQKMNLSLSQLSEKTGIHKGTISKIEKGDVKRPEYSTICPIAKSLNIPFDMLIELHAEVDRRADTHMNVLEDAIDRSESSHLIRFIATKFLESPSDESHSLIERLFKFTSALENEQVKLILFQLIADYSRSHGIMPYLARGLFQVYLIERNDFSRIKSTYDSGRYIVQYANFLSTEDRTAYYYKLGIHAFNLLMYDQSIEWCLNVINEADSENMYYVNALGILRDSYYYLKDIEKSELYSQRYLQYDLPHVRANAILMTALINAQKGDTSLAIDQLRSFLNTCDEDRAVPALNQLLRIFLHEKRLDDIEQLLEYRIPLLTCNPYIASRLAEYNHLKGQYFLLTGNLDLAMSSLLESARLFCQIDQSDKEKESIGKILKGHLHNSAVLSEKALEELIKYFDQNGTNEYELEGLI